jgi:shikimate dehydrogenase
MSPIRRAAVLGKPVAHSFSPALHHAAHAALGLDWGYQAIECDEAGLPGLLGRMGPDWIGVSVTMPLKRAALSLADTASAVAAEVGAANTLLFDGAGITAHNTDVAGIEAALREAGVTVVEHGLILGAGGTAQAALAALRDMGDLAPMVVVRDRTRTRDLQATAARLGVTPRIVESLPHLPNPLSGVVISTLPPGAADLLNVSEVAPGCVVLDVVYTPWPTPFTLSAQQAGARIISGLEMLVHQAAGQVRLMTGLPAPLEEMRAALAEAVAARDEAAASGR